MPGAHRREEKPKIKAEKIINKRDFGFLHSERRVDEPRRERQLGGKGEGQGQAFVDLVTSHE